MSRSWTRLDDNDVEYFEGVCRIQVRAAKVRTKNER